MHHEVRTADETIADAAEMADWLEDKYNVTNIYIPSSGPLSFANKVTVPIPDQPLEDDELPSGWTIGAVCDWGEGPAQVRIEKSGGGD